MPLLALPLVHCESFNTCISSRARLSIMLLMVNFLAWGRSNLLLHVRRVISYLVLHPLIHTWYSWGFSCLLVQYSTIRYLVHTYRTVKLNKTTLSLGRNAEAGFLKMCLGGMSYRAFLKMCLGGMSYRAHTTKRWLWKHLVERDRSIDASIGVCANSILPAVEKTSFGNRWRGGVFSCVSEGTR